MDGIQSRLGQNPVTTWPESSYELARIRLRITEVNNEAANKWNNNLIQTQLYAQTYNWDDKGRRFRKHMPKSNVGDMVMVKETNYVNPRSSTA